MKLHWTAIGEKSRGIHATVENLRATIVEHNITRYEWFVLENEEVIDRGMETSLEESLENIHEVLAKKEAKWSFNRRQTAAMVKVARKYEEAT